MSASHEQAQAPRVRRILRWAGFIAGLALIALAIHWALGGSRDAWVAVAQAPATLFIAAAALCVVTLLHTAYTFHVLIRRYGRVGYFEMTALIGAAWLLNYLPFRPGMFGRIAYHRAVNRIPIRDSAMALIWANVLSLLAAATLGAAIITFGLLFAAGPRGIAVATAVPVPLLAVAAWYAHMRRPEPDPEVWRLLAALGARFAELLAWAGRYWVCFQIVGQPISWPGALAIASATTLASMVPLFGNGLGLREWTVGIVAAALPAGIAVVSSPDTTAGLAADLVNRAVEVAVAIPLGAAGAAYLAARRRESPAPARADKDQGGDPPAEDLP